MVCSQSCGGIETSSDYFPTFPNKTLVCDFSNSGFHGDFGYELELVNNMIYFKPGNLNRWYNNMGSWLDRDICAGT